MTVSAAHCPRTFREHHTRWQPTGPPTPAGHPAPPAIPWARPGRRRTTPAPAPPPTHAPNNQRPARRTAEGDITPAIRRVEAQLDHGSLIPDTEKFALK